MKRPLSTQRMMLLLKGALLHCLDENMEPLPNAFASGFVRKESDGTWLYTCWYVVTGFDPHNLRVKKEPNRCYLKVSMQNCERQPGVELVGGEQSFVVPLYNATSDSAAPLWFQDDRHVPHPDLNTIDIHVPFWHDLVKVKIPSEIDLSDMQTVNEYHVLPDNHLLTPGDKCMVVGYPFGYSPDGPVKPTAVALTRFVAGTSIFNRRRQLLLESPAAPGMSGGPVFVERGDCLFLFGIYTGLIYPDCAAGSNEALSALGVIDNITFALQDDHYQLVNPPTVAHIVS